MSDLHRNLGVKSTLKIMIALSETCTPRIVQQSFIKCGIVRDLYESFKTILANCTAEITDAEERILWELLPKCVKQMEKHGEIFDWWFHKQAPSLFAKDPSGNKDDRCVTQRRTCVITHPEFLLREKEKTIEELALEATRWLIQQDREDKRLQKELQDEARRAVSAAKKAATEAAKAAKEAARLAAFSPDPVDIAPVTEPILEKRKRAREVTLELLLGRPRLA